MLLLEALDFAKRGVSFLAQRLLGEVLLSEGGHAEARQEGRALLERVQADGRDKEIAFEVRRAEELLEA